MSFRRARRSAYVISKAEGKSRPMAELDPTYLPDELTQKKITRRQKSEVNSVLLDMHDDVCSTLTECIYPTTTMMRYSIEPR